MEDVKIILGIVNLWIIYYDFNKVVNTVVNNKSMSKCKAVLDSKKVKEFRVKSKAKKNNKKK